MEGIIKTDIKNLVLKVSSNYNHVALNLEEWQDFLDVLCGDREYQKEAIKTALVFLASGEYDMINNLVAENYEKNEDIKTIYSSLSQYLKDLQMPNILSATIDLATGTGKSYVIFGICFIMMAIAKVKRTLILCPSLTIESELNKKFQNLLCKFCTVSRFRRRNRSR